MVATIEAVETLAAGAEPEPGSWGTAAGWGIVDVELMVAPKKTDELFVSCSAVLIYEPCRGTIWFLGGESR